MGEQEAKALAKGDSSRKVDGDGIIYNRKCGWKDAATSGTAHTLRGETSRNEVAS